jgi:Zn-dependent peptidase ImmA (M78 family)
MRDAEGRWHSDKWEVALRASVFTAAQRGEPHARFVAFHEISYYACGHEGTRYRATDKSRSYSAGKIKHEESEATRFAVILMAPEYPVPENASAKDIASQFSMSLTAAILRKEEVDRIRRQRRGQLRPLPESIKELLRNAGDQGFPIQTQLDD